MRSDFEFDSSGTKCAAWRYQPESVDSTPYVVMAHGFSVVGEQRLDACAERFSRAGMAVLLFDYRRFGASAGEPRHLLSIRRQLQDGLRMISAAKLTTPLFRSSRISGK